MPNSSNEVIAAYDYDAWGYALREWKSGDDAKYRFTGKERDNETNYDYFGARYYDARIGRWGGVDAKYDQYIKFSPYVYSFNNSLLFKDIDGKDATVVIDNLAKTITISVKDYYSKDDNLENSLGSTKEARLEKFEKYSDTQWNSAAKDLFNINDGAYKVSFEFIKEVVLDGVDPESKVKDNPGSNVAISGEVFVDKEGKENPYVPAGVGGNKLIIYDYKSPLNSTGPHEKGHQMGLSHPSNYETCTSIMCKGTENRKAPSREDVMNIIKKLDFSKENQIIKSGK